MLKKLMKYEWKATNRIFLPLYIAVIITTFIQVFSMNWSDTGILEKYPILMMAIVFAYGAVVASTFVVTIVIMIQRYYKNILGVEGYLMNTLPVKGWELIISKATISTFWAIASSFVVIISFPIAIFITHPSAFVDFMQRLFGELFWKDFIQAWGSTGSFIIFIIELLVAIIVACMASIMKIYGAMSLGHLVHKYRLLASVGFYILFGMIENFVLGSIGFQFASLLEDQNFFHNIAYGNFQAVNGVALLAIVLEVGVGAIYFFISKYVLDNKLNLE